MSESFIPLSEPHFTGNEWTYVKECLDSGWVSSAGSYVDRFECEMARAAGTRAAVAVANGTAALHVALITAGVRAGDEVVVSDLTFIAPANAVRYIGAVPAFIDAEPEYWQMDVGKLEDFLLRGCRSEGGALRNKVTGRRIGAILPVHILGNVCDLDPLLELAGRFEIPVIEDATECLGATYKNRSAGSLGRLGCFSYNGNKIITTGGGGMIVTDDVKAAERAKYLTTQAKDDPLEFVHEEVGFNFRLPNILAALGCAQLEKLPEYVARKRAIAEAYSKEFEGVKGIVPMREAAGTVGTYWLYTVRLTGDGGGPESRALLRALKAQGIQTRPLWQPMHLSPAQAGSFFDDCSTAERLNRECLSLPCSVGLSEEDRQRVSRAVLKEMRS